MKKIYFLFVLICLSIQAGTVFGQSTTFHWNGTTAGTGSVQVYTVPLGIPTLSVTAVGGAGGAAYNCCTTQPNPLGGLLVCNVAVTGGELLYAYVGSAGQNWVGSGVCVGGYNGGGSTGTSGSTYAAAGGGGTDLRTSPSGSAYTGVLMAAGGAGGGGDYSDAGGAGGGTTGGTGTLGACGGGVTGPACTTGYGLGSAGQGASPLIYACGGGGGGWWGGNGGVDSYPYGGGGGGSSNVNTSFCTVITNTQGYSGANGNGSEAIVFSAPYYAYGFPGILNFGLVAIGSSSVLSFNLWSPSLQSGSSPLTITAPAGSGYLVSTSVGSGYASSITVPYTGTTLASLPIYVKLTPTASASYNNNITVTGGGVPANSNVVVTGNGVAPCTGTPTPGTTTASPTSGTGTTSFTLSLTGATIAGGLTYQWQQSTTLGGTYTNIYGATNVTYTFTGLPANRYFQCIIGCSFGGTTATSTPALVTMTGTVVTPPAASVTAVPTSLAFGSVTTGTSSAPLQYFTVTGTGLSVGPLTLNAPTGFSISLDGLTWVAGPGTLTLPYTPGYPTSNLSATNIYVQFNPTVTGTLVSGNIAITGGNLSAPVNVAVSGTGQAICSGTPTAGTASISSAIAVSASPLTLSLAGTSAAGGLTYQWQSSPTGTGSWTNIAGAITPTYNFVGLTGTTYYQCVVTCPSGSNATSNSVSASLASSEAASSCTIGTSYATCPSCGFVIATAAYPLVIAGSTPPGISDGTSVPSGASYEDNSATMSCAMNSGTTYTAVVDGFPGDGLSYQFWIDFNGDGIFQTSESVGGGTPGTSRTSITLTIPAGVSPGIKRMRVESDYDISGDAPYYTVYPNMNPCPVGYPYYYEVRDYSVFFGVSVVPPCATPINPGIVSPSIAASCSSFSPSLYNVGEPVLYTGVKYQWESASSASGPWAAISGATGQNYVPATVSAVGTTYYRDSVTCINGPAVATTPAQAITLNPQPVAITGGPFNVCTTLTTALADATTGGVWTSSNTANATVGSTGVVTGVTGGTVPNITYTLPTGGCYVTQPVTVNLNPLPIGGTTPICGSLTSAFTDATTGGVWSSANTAVATVGSTGTVTGGSSSSVGSTTISYTSSSGCSVTYPLTVNALSAITGSGSLCIGYTTSLADATAGGTWSSSNPGVATINSSGVVSSVSYGSTNISYSAPSGCVALLTLNVTPPPSTFTVTGGGSYCSGPASVYVGLNGSNSGIGYQLYNTLTGPVGPTVYGGPLGGAFEFGTEPAGTYYVVANPGGGCATTMTGTATVTVLPLPTAYSVTGGGAYCPGGTGVYVYLNNSTIGINYQLFVGGVPVGTTVPGTGAPLNFGLQTTAGSYTVVATNTTTGCTNTMSGSATVSVNASPTPETVTGGGPFCVGGTGMAIGLSGSVSGTNYQLTLSGVPVGVALAGTGSPLSFGLITGSGVYNVVATTTATGCSATMSGTATITATALPTVYTVTGGGGYCAGSSTGVSVGLNSSTVGVNYQLWYTATGGSAVMVGSAVPGTGVAITFSGSGTAGTFTNVGSYSVVATSASSPYCSSNMFGSVSVFTNPLPATFSVTGGGNYCAGGSGVVVGLSGSVIGTTYSLYDGASLVSAASGTGSSFNFGTFTASGTYTATATTTLTGCNSTMGGSVTVNITPLPIVNTVTGGGSYCTGTTPTGVSIGLSSSSTGINYQLYNGSTLVSTLAGTGSPLSFTNELSGTYTVVAVTTTTPVCSSNMTGSIAVNANAVPALYSVTGGGNYCAGALPAGMHVGLSASNAGINYSLYKVPGSVITSMLGTGSALDFGLQTAGTYKIAAVNTATGCADTMSGTAVVIMNTLPNNLYTVSASNGGQYCAGGTGVNILTLNSDAGVNYQVASSGIPVGPTLAGSGSSLSFGPLTGTGPYTVIATSGTTGCSTSLTGSVTVTINPVPAVASVTGGGAYCGGSLGTTGVLVGLGSSATGISYQLYNGTATVGAPIPGTGSALNFGLQPAGSYTIVASSVAGCTSNMSGAAVVTLGAAPASTYLVTGGGPYCSGGTGVSIGLNSSSPGVSYQLMTSGLPVGPPVLGTGVAISLGSGITTSGAYTVVGTNTTSGCSATMTGGTTVTASTLPTPHSVTGSGNYCPGGTGVQIGLNGSNLGTTYQLYNGSTLVAGASVPGTGAPINFGLQTATGTYTVVANNGCTGSMSGSATVGLYALPTAYTVTGGGNYCPGGTGVPVGLSGSATGLVYHLQNGAGPVDSAIGSGFSISFGAQTASGIYTVIASSPVTGCSSNMTGTATVVINTPPTAFNVTGGGNYCSAGAGKLVGLDGSVAGTQYQLYNGMSTVGSPVHGTGSAISFGLQTAAGTYTVVATSLSTTCTNNMSGSATISIVPLPTAETVSAGGNYCAGASGIDVTIGSSQTGVNYQLYNGATAVGTSVSGSGSGLDFGYQTAAGTYTVVGTTAGVGGCSNTMAGSSIIVVNPLPTAYTISGGGNYCAGGAGLHIMLSGSNTGIHYQLMNGVTAVGAPVSGIGSALDFGLQTAAGSYTIVATNTTTGCTNTMSGAATIAINTVPSAYSVSSSASNYCAGGAGVDVQLSGSDAGIQYQLYNGSSTLGGPVTGTGFDIDFGLQTLAGTYTVVAINPGTTCSSNMTGGATILIDPLPTAFTIVGGGNYCSGGTGVHVGLNGSNTGISYQLYVGGGATAVGSPMMGTGYALDFGLQTAPGTYSVVATNVGTTCTNNMGGSATITITALPAVNTVTGGGAYCAGTPGVHIGLNGSTAGVNYQLYNGSALVGTPVAGTGIAIDFGLQTAAGTYTVMGMNSTSSCSSNMAGSTTVTINSLPSAYAVNGGGNYCPGSDGVLVGLGGSATGVSYQLFNGTAPSGSSLLGTGAALSFGAKTDAGTYSVIATNSATGCSSTMSGTVSVGLNPLPGVYTVLGGGNYCAGGTGVHVGLTGSATGINYQLFTTSGSTGSPVAGTGGPIDFGAQTVAGTYTVVASNGTTGCTNNMAGSASIGINPTVSPSVNLATGIGDTICEGHSVTLSTTSVNGGSAPMFSWSINGSPVSGTGSTYSYIPSNGDVVGVSMTSNATCATPATVANSLTLSVLANGNPTISIAAVPGQTVCQGTMVTFNNANTFGGTPSFTWIVDGANVSTAAFYTYTPANGDVIYAIMNSNYRCRLENTVTSNHITMEVDDSLIPVVTINAYPGTDIAAGQSVTLTASAVNAGSAPGYQWFVNGAPVPGANAASYTSSNYSNGDSVTCMVTASGGCTGLSGFNSVRIVVGTEGVKNVSANNSNIQLIPNPNNGNFTIKGSLGTTDDEEVSVEISDMLGQIIYKDKVMVHGGNIDQKIQLSSSIANGMYLLNLNSASANNVFHVVIEQ